MIKLFRYDDPTQFKLFENYLFSNVDVERVQFDLENNKIVIDGVEYFASEPQIAVSPPQVTVNVPEPQVTVNVPESPAPQVTVNTPVPWTEVVGRSIEYKYYEGIEDDNPSGNIRNLKIARYIDENNNTARIETYAYDAYDRIIRTEIIEEAP